MLRDEPIRSRAVATLEDLTAGARVVGVRPDGPVSVVAVKWLGTTAIGLTYKDSAGRVANELLFRDRESSLEIVSAGPKERDMASGLKSTAGDVRERHSEGRGSGREHSNRC